MVDRAIGVRDNEEITVRPGLDVSGDAKVTPNQQALAFGDIEFVQVVGDQIVEPRITEGKMQTIGRQLETKKKTAHQECARGAHKHVPFKLRTQSPALNKAERRRRDRKLPTEFRIVVMCAGQHV